MARRLIAWPRRVRWAAVVLAVVACHALVTRELAQSVADWSAGSKQPPRLAAVFTREIVPAPPPAAAPPAPAAPPRGKPRPKAPATAPALAASEPAMASTEPAPEPAPEPHEPIVDAPADAASAPVQEVDPAAAAPALPPQAPVAAASAPSWPSHWPASTQLTYSIVGWYQGNVEGSAKVEWLREGSRYQVHLDVWIGPKFAPIVSRRMSSDGELTAAGLHPLRYDEETKVAFREPRRRTLRFEPGTVVLADGRRLPGPPGVQDAASQFVHLTWLFTTQPQRLEAGSTIEFPLALPRGVDTWVYDVMGMEDLRAPFGLLPVVHVKPRRVSRPGGDLVAEAWFAPSLLYLPVRIRIHQDAQTYVDMTIDSPPRQAVN